MMLLRQGVQNQIVVTLNELSDPSLPNNWLFVFEMEVALGQSNQTYKIQLSDVSLSPQSYNLFYLNEGTDVDFKHVGDYMYSVYQMPNDTSTDETLGVLVERNKMRLVKENEPIPTYSTVSNTFIYDPANIS